MFEARVNLDEMQVLAYLHENVAGYGPEFRVKIDTLAADLAIDRGSVVKAISYLAQHGLVGTQEQRQTKTAGKVFLMLNAFSTVWLTGLGESYLRSVEAQPGVAQRVTVAAVKKANNVFAVAFNVVLSELVKCSLRASGVTV